jgi:Stress responsive A/B Barrel Domain
MIVNVLRFSFKEGASDTERAAAIESLERLGASSSVAFSVTGRGLGDPSDGYTHAYCVAWKDLAELERYMLHEPEHPAADAAFLPAVERLGMLNFSDDPDPALWHEMEALHKKRLENPELAQLIGSISETTANLVPE